MHRFPETGDPIAGSTDPNTAGNGSIMRLGPVALRRAGDPKRAISAARAKRHDTEGCALLAEILVDAIASGEKESVLRRRFALESSIASVAAGSWRW